MGAGAGGVKAKSTVTEAPSVSVTFFVTGSAPSAQATIACSPGSSAIGWAIDAMGWPSMVTFGELVPVTLTRTDGTRLFRTSSSTRALPCASRKASGA